MDGILDQVHLIRDAVGADLVYLMYQGNLGGQSSAGLPRELSTAERDEGFGVGINGGDFAHEADALGDDEKPLRETIEKFRSEELEHRDEALQREAQAAPGYPVLTAAIKSGSRLAIWLSSRF